MELKEGEVKVGEIFLLFECDFRKEVMKNEGKTFVSYFLVQPIFFEPRSDWMKVEDLKKYSDQITLLFYVKNIKDNLTN